jgi:hypothetical protein
MTRTSRREVESLLVAAGCRAVPASQRLDVDAIAPATAVVDRSVPSRRELRAMLRTAGARPVPALSPAFVAFAEPHAAAAPSSTVALESRRRSRRPAVLMGAAAAALTLVLVGLLTGLMGGQAAEAQLQLASVVDTVVVLPDGRTVDGTRGMTLPNGAIVRVGPHGRASAGGVDLGPGDEAVVEHGRLVQTATTEAAATVPATPSPGAEGVEGTEGAVTPAVDESLPPVEDVPAPPPAGGDGSTEPAPVSEIPQVAPTLPAVTLPTLPEPKVERPSLPGVPLP